MNVSLSSRSSCIERHPASKKAKSRWLPVDQVDKILIRVLMSQIADLNQAGAFQRVHLDYLALA
jgi:hypothetical protein